MPRWNDSRALSGSVGQGASNDPQDVANLQQAKVAAGVLPPNPNNLLYDPHDGRFLNAVLTLQENLGVRQNAVIKAGGTEEQELQRALQMRAAQQPAAGDHLAGGSVRELGASRNGSPSQLSSAYGNVSNNNAPDYRFVPEAWTMEPDGGPAAPPAATPSPARPPVNPWNPVAAYERADAIAGEELARRARAHNDLEDAMRHAEWNRRMAQELGPGWAVLFGTGHELKNIWDYGLHGNELLMDLHNNMIGMRDGVAGRSINPAKLKSIR